MSFPRPSFISSRAASSARVLVVALTAIMLPAAGCVSEEGIHDPSDLEPVDTDGKADGPFSVFDANRLVSDDSFFDVDAVSASAVQTFLEDTPYGKRSFLADHTFDDGERLSAALVRVARAHGLNPLVLLVTLQKEAGLISRSSRPSTQRVDFAFGCGCSDGSSCSSAFKGLDKQLDCAAEKLNEYTADLASNGSTISGWAVGAQKRTLEGTAIVPSNTSTAALYTYTPWVLRGSGGNWLFWNVWRRYATAFGYARGLQYPFNGGFIGGNCTADSDCLYSGGRCLFADTGVGTCSSSCDVTCPDRSGAFATTFCIGDGSQGFCVAQCDTTLSATGCGERQRCERRARHTQPSVTREVCVPEG